MPEPPVPRLTLGDLANRVLEAADPAARVPLVAQLARGTRTAEQITGVAEHFLAAGPPGRRVLLEWVARVRADLPESVLDQLRPLLSDRKVPASVRILAAARALRSLPDKVEAVEPIARALTRGLSPLRRLERLRQLQHQTEKSRGLDLLIERREKRVKMDCPRCGVRLPRVGMIRHLWNSHGLMLEHGKIRSPHRTVEELHTEHAASHDTTVLDRASLLSDPPALRAWVAAADTPAEDVATLLGAAADHRAGLCPGCFAELPAPLPPLPPPLTLAGGRLAGDGFLVEVGGASWFRTLTVASPTRIFRSGPDGRGALGRRGAATLAAAAVLLAAVAHGLFLRHPAVSHLPAVLVLALIAAVVYAVVWYTRKPLPNPADRAVDAAWTILARRLVKANQAAEWLTRLCRVSPGRGDPVARAGVLKQVTDRAAEGGTEADVQLLAAAGVLQVEDAARHGRDRVAGIAGVAAAGFRGDQPIGYAEYAAGCFLDLAPAPEPGDLARLRTLLLAAAFDAGLNPRNLIDLWAVAPALRRAMAVEPLHRLGLLHGVWTMRPARRWEQVAPAESVFDLCRTSPNISGRLLRDFPDLLLYHRPDPDTFDQLGPVLVCARGVVVGGQMVADPDADVKVVKGGRPGGYELVFGRHRLRLVHRPAGDFAGTVREWLRFRAWALLPLLDNYLAPGSRAVAARVLGPFERRCDHCAAVAAVAVGTVGTPVR